jgi:phospho-N-acetylmuramoyl-pentapeptide-transferase
MDLFLVKNMIFGPFFFLLSLLLSLVISWGVSVCLIRIARKSFFTRPRLHTPSSHHKKNPTIAIGGIAIIIGLISGLLLCLLPVTGDYIVILSGLLLFGAIGFFDDCVKMHNGIGISARNKALLQFCAASIVIGLMHFFNPSFFTTALFYSDSLWFYGAFVVWNLFIIIGTVNAVNLTDGLDMLAVLVVIPMSAFLFFVSLIQGNSCIAFINASLIGSLCGFAYFNKQPAMLWMGDVGSLSIGAALALSALLLRIELFLPLVAIVPVFETVSVIVQVAGFKLSRKKFFKMAPLHHHFELCGYSENAIVKSACGLSILVALFGSIVFLIIK